MRRIVLPLLTLALSACAHITVRDVDTKEEATLQVQALRAGIVASLQGLHSRHCAAGRCYAATEVSQLFDAIRKNVRSLIPPEAAALADGFEGVIDVEFRRLGDPKLLSPIRPVRMPPVDPELGYEAGPIDAALQRIVAAFDRVLSYNDLAPTLQVDSDPNQAEFMIQVGSNALTQRKATVTDQVPNVWRGIYSGTVHKSGYKDATVNLDLMSDGRTTLSCKLVAVSARQDSVCQRR